MKTLTALAVGLFFALPGIVLGFVGDPTYQPPVSEPITIDELQQQMTQEHFKNSAYAITLLQSSIVDVEGDGQILAITYRVPAELFGAVDTFMGKEVHIYVSEDGEIETKYYEPWFSNLVTSVQDKFFMERLDASIPQVLANYNGGERYAAYADTLESTVVTLKTTN